MSQRVQKCIDEAVLKEFTRHFKGDIPSRRLIRNERCLGNGQQIAEKLATKVNVEYPDLEATYSRNSPFDWGMSFVLDKFLGNRDNKEWRVDTVSKTCNSENSEETLMNMLHE